MTALLLDAHLKSSLAAIRSLGRHGIPIVAGSHARSAMGLHSLYATKVFVYPSPLQDRRGFQDAVIRQSDRAGQAVLLAFSDSTLLPLVEDGRFLGKSGIYVMPPDREHFDIAFDKARTLAMARKIGVEIPKTYPWASGAEFSGMLRELTYPVVIKPRRSVNWSGNSGVCKSAAFAFSAEDLQKQFTPLRVRTGECPLVQEYIRGEETGVEFLCDRGRVLAACAHRRIRSESPTGGSGTLKETVPLSYQGLGERAQLVAELNWSGPIMVEFKTGRESGIPKLMEINGRFWGSLPLAAAAGVDFPHLYYRLACGEHVAQNLEFRTGVVSRHFLTDLKNLALVLFAKDPMRKLAYPSRLGACKDFLLPPSHCKSDVLDMGDMKPSLAEIFDTGARLLSRVRH
jgi:predicted ATP-grasp superfamily ATP-dependent carboligase